MSPSSRFKAGVIRYRSKIKYRYHICDQLSPRSTIKKALPGISIRKVCSRAICSRQAYGTPNKNSASKIRLQYLASISRMDIFLTGFKNR